MAEVKELVKELSGKYGNKRESLIPILQGIIDRNYYLSKEAMLEVARELDVSAAEIYGTASFYSFLDTEAKGKYKIRVCKSITCDMKGKNSVVATMEGMLKIKVGETTQDERFSLLETNCIGLCDEGPAMLINDECFTKLTPEKVRTILGDYVRNKF
ncbi:MAG: NAD(P)H-dependent oxidoreductase subunit E [Bacteroidales bacterium]|nr:NAD(P)H-dependent oxidoreductase subunit E [Bacteroidales bacterium]